MCVAIMYTRENEGDVKDACAAFLDIAAGGVATVQEWFVLKLMLLKLPNERLNTTLKTY